MSFWLKLVGIVVALVILSYVLSAIVGLLFWVGVAVIVVGAITAIIRHMIGERAELKPVAPRESRKLDKSTDRALKDLEKKVGQ
jgi:hypothetical protein